MLFIVAIAYSLSHSVKDFTLVEQPSTYSVLILRWRKCRYDQLQTKRECLIHQAQRNLISFDIRRFVFPAEELFFMVVSRGPARLVEAPECLSINIEVPTANILRHSSVVFFSPMSVFQSVGEHCFVQASTATESV